MMNERITRRGFAKAGAVATVGLTSLETAGALGSPPADTATQRRPGAGVLEVRPFQLMCIVCRIGEGKIEDLGDARLTEILAAVREDPKIPIRLRSNRSSVIADRCRERRGPKWNLLTGRSTLW